MNEHTVQRMPIIFIAFNRPDLASITLQHIRQYRPTHMYVALDGPRDSHRQDELLCTQMREVVDASIDWDCDLITDISPVNLGAARRVSSAITAAFRHYDRAIVLEDDLSMNSTFFSFCEHGLDRFEDNDRIFGISGNNFQKGRRRTSSSYFFSKYFHTWGWATWKRAWDKFHLEMIPPENQTDADVIRNYPVSIREVRYWENRFKATRDRIVDAWDYPWTYNMWKHRGLAIIPEQNLVTNIGFRSDATHTSWYSKRSHPFQVSHSDLGPIVDNDRIMQDIQADTFTFSNIFSPPLWTRFKHLLGQRIS